MKTGPENSGPGPADERNEQEIKARSEDVGRRLDLFLADRLPGLSRSRAQKLIEAGMVRVKGELCSNKNYRLRAGDPVGLTIPPAEDSALEPEAISLDIVYEDEDLLVINKPRGMVVHPGPGHRRGTLVNALLHHCSNLSGIGGVKRPGIVHRLDKDTSGLLLVAKNDLAHRSLSTQLKTRQLKREYIALVSGRVKPALGRIEAPIARHPRHRKKMAVVEGGRAAVTRYRVLNTLVPTAFSCSTWRPDALTRSGSICPTWDTRWSVIPPMPKAGGTLCLRALPSPRPCMPAA